MAPELLAAGREATAAADLFSLGATLYEVRCILIYTPKDAVSSPTMCAALV